MEYMVNSIAVIPARGGSTRVPKKNIMEFYDKPMIAYTIEACKNSGKFNRILVSTDDAEIADISIKYGAEVPFLRDRYADNNSPVSEAVLHAVYQAEDYWEEKYDIIAMAMANCPIRDAEDIKNAYDNFIERKYKSQISCFKFGFMNPWWAIKLNEKNEGERVLDVPTNVRSQDLPELYCPTGAIWVCKKEHLEKYKSFYGEHNFYELNWKNSIDIDNYEDVEMAKIIYEYQKAKSII